MRMIQKVSMKNDFPRIFDFFFIFQVVFSGNKNVQTISSFKISSGHENVSGNPKLIKNWLTLAEIEAGDLKLIEIDLKLIEIDFT